MEPAKSDHVEIGSDVESHRTSAVSFVQPIDGGISEEQSPMASCGVSLWPACDDVFMEHDFVL